VQRLNLEAPLRSRFVNTDPRQAWEQFASLRLSIYEEMLDTPGFLSEYLCPHNVGLLDYARQEEFRVGLATMSHRPQAEKVLGILGIKERFDVIATRDDVQKGKPDPEIYTLVSRQLGSTPSETLVIEDSVTGIRAALSAGMHCVAVTSNFTRPSVHSSGLLEPRWIVDDPVLLLTVARQLIADERVAGLISGTMFPGASTNRMQPGP
jgi:HAD superfamily hydrolase (TIGR01509 family)